MEFNYSNEEFVDFRNYGLLENKIKIEENFNTVKDEENPLNYFNEILEKKLKLAENNIKILEDLNKKYENDIRSLTETLLLLQKEFSNRLIELEKKIK
jgi:hypothetical protein